MEGIVFLVFPVLFDVDGPARERSQAFAGGIPAEQEGALPLTCVSCPERRTREDRSRVASGLPYVAAMISGTTRIV